MYYVIVVIYKVFWIELAGRLFQDSKPLLPSCHLNEVKYPTTKKLCSKFFLGSLGTVCSLQKEYVLNCPPEPGSNLNALKLQNRKTQLLSWVKLSIKATHYMLFLKGRASYWKLIEKPKNMVDHWLDFVSEVRERASRLYLTQIFTAEMGEPKEETVTWGKYFILFFLPNCFSFQPKLKFWY